MLKSSTASETNCIHDCTSLYIIKVKPISIQKKNKILGNLLHFVAFILTSPSLSRFHFSLSSNSDYVFAYTNLSICFLFTSNLTSKFTQSFLQYSQPAVRLLFFWTVPTILLSFKYSVHTDPQITNYRKAKQSSATQRKASVLVGLLVTWLVWCCAAFMY